MARALLMSMAATLLAAAPAATLLAAAPAATLLAAAPAATLLAAAPAAAAPDCSRTGPTTTTCVRPGHTAITSTPNPASSNPLRGWGLGWGAPVFGLGGGGIWLGL